MRSLSLLCCLGLLACGSSSPADPDDGGILVTVVPSPLQLVVGGRGNVTAIARDAAGNPLALPSLVWSIDNSSIASVSQNGEVVGLARGTTQVVARSGSMEGRGTVVVDQAPLVATTLEIVPISASTTVGGSVAFTAIARDATGAAILPTPAVTWSSAIPAVATINASTGVATGVATGTTQITARAGAIMAPPATLTVGSVGPCDGIQSVNAFKAQIQLQWTHEATVDGQRIRAEHAASIDVRLMRLGPSSSWFAPTVGTGRITDRLTKLSTQETSRIDAQGALITQNRPTVDFEVDLQTCRYSFTVIPWLNSVTTDFDGTQVTTTTATGHLYSGWIDLGDWRGLNAISEVDGADIPAHSVVWILGPGHAAKAHYLASAYGALLWGSTASASEAPAGNVTVTWAITPDD